MSERLVFKFQMELQRMAKYTDFTHSQKTHLSLLKAYNENYGNTTVWHRTPYR